MKINKWICISFAIIFAFFTTTALTFSILYSTAKKQLNIEKINNETPNNKFNPKNDEFEKLKNNLKTKQDEYQKLQSILSDKENELKQKNDEYESLRTEYDELERESHDKFLNTNRESKNLMKLNDLFITFMRDFVNVARKLNEIKENNNPESFIFKENSYRKFIESLKKIKPILDKSLEQFVAEQNKPANMKDKADDMAGSISTLLEKLYSLNSKHDKQNHLETLSDVTESIFWNLFSLLDLYKYGFI